MIHRNAHGTALVNGPNAPAHDASRVLRAHEADNIQLARDVMHAAAAAWPFLPALWPREQAPRMAWAFVKYHTRYQAETGDQFIRMPWALVREGVGDCKSQAVFIAAVCKACGCDAAIRFVVQPGEDHYGHVYAVVDNYIADPLLEFGKECTYIRSHTVTLPDA